MVHPPVQHCEGVWQMKPSGWHVPPQKPASHEPTQQSSLAKHFAPCGLHASPPQYASNVQAPLQHGRELVHGVPSAVQEVPPQKPPSHEMPEQHAALSSQAAPRGVHDVPPQNPSKQSRAQQSVDSEHSLPRAWQRMGGPHTWPSVHTRSAQQSATVSQKCPSG
jgi:hypothetical protein